MIVCYGIVSPQSSYVGVPWWPRGLGSQHYHCCGSGHCLGSGLTPDPRIATGTAEKKKAYVDTLTLRVMELGGGAFGRCCQLDEVMRGLAPKMGSVP